MKTRHIWLFRALVALTFLVFCALVFSASITITASRLAEEREAKSRELEAQKTEAYKRLSVLRLATVRYTFSDRNLTNRPPLVVRDLVYPPFGGGGFCGEADIRDPWGSEYRLETKYDAKGRIDRVAVYTTAPDGERIE